MPALAVRALTWRCDLYHLIHVYSYRFTTVFPKKRIAICVNNHMGRMHGGNGVTGKEQATTRPQPKNYPTFSQKQGGTWGTQPILPHISQ